jgi:hypothetical protein
MYFFNVNNLLCIAIAKTPIQYIPITFPLGFRPSYFELTTDLFRNY